MKSKERKEMREGNVSTTTNFMFSVVHQHGQTDSSVVSMVLSSIRVRENLDIQENERMEQRRQRGGRIENRRRRRKVGGREKRRRRMRRRMIG